jgi:RimJ/RimL family protein N-acetyltransferase
MRLRPPDPPLSDGVVSLRPWTDEDVSAIVAACRDPQIPKWIPLIPSPYTEKDAREYVAQTKEWWSEGTAATFAITDGERPVGSIGLHPSASDEQRAAAGYWVAREARGRGYATRALRLVTRWSLEDLGMLRLDLIAEPENTASCAVAERVGFQREGILRAYLATPARGRRDVAMYSLLPGELRAS